MRLLLFIDAQRRTLVGGLNDPHPATLPELMQGDTLDVVLQSVERNAETAVQYYRGVPTPYATIKCAITVGADVPPQEGTIRLGLTGGGVADVTRPLPPNVAKAELAELLNALPGVIAKGGLKVLTTNAATNIFLLRWNNAAETAVFDFRENLLEPACETRSTLAPLPNGRIQALKIRQRPLAFTDQFSLPTAPVVTTAVVRAGNGTRNAIQSISVPRASVGQAHFTFASLSTRILSVSGLTPAAVAAALNELYADGQTRFAVTQASSTVLYVECVGPLALSDAPAIGVEMHDQAPLETPTARLPLDGPSLELAFDGADKLPLNLEVEITDTDGEVGTPIRAAVTIRNDIIDPGMMLAADPPWLDPDSPEYPPYDPDAAAILVPGAYILSLGSGGGDSGETSDPTGRVHVVTHNLATYDLLIELHETGSTRRRVSDELYRITKPTVNQVQIEFPEATFPVAPTAGQYRLTISAVSPARMALPAHTHPIDDILTLRAILNGLLAGQNPGDVWPAIPDGKLPAHIAWRVPTDQDGNPGDYRFDRLPDDLASLHTPTLDDRGDANTPGYLRLDQVPPEVLRVGDDGTVGVLVGTPPNQTILNLFTLTGTPTTVVFGDVFNSSLTQIITAALQGGGTLPPGLTPMAIADLSLTFPAQAALHSSGDGGPQALTLLRALRAYTDGGTLAADQEPPGADDAKKLYTVATVDSLTVPPGRNRPSQRFLKGAQFATDGNLWWAVRPEDGVLWPLDYERELFTLAISQGMLPTGARFSVDFTARLALTSAARATAALRLGLYAFPADSGGAPRFVDWIVNERVMITDADTSHRFTYAVARASGGALSATATAYGEALTSPPVPASAKFVLSGRLECFDLVDSGDFTGQFGVHLTGARASILKL